LFFLDAADHIEPSLVDGVHPDEKGHFLLGKAVASKVLTYLMRGMTVEPIKIIESKKFLLN
jgi:hypothetical protein